MQATRLSWGTAVLAALTLVTPTAAQEKSQEDLARLRAEKLAKPVFENAVWYKDYDHAREEAKDSGKVLLVYFTRSYAP